MYLKDKRTGEQLSSRRRRGMKGQILVMSAIMMVALFGFLALSTDLGYLYFRKRQMQTAADAGALYAVQEIRRGNANSRIISQGKRGSSENGFTDAADGTVVTVNSPPLSGTFSGGVEAVEVIVCQDQRTFFMAIMNKFSAGLCARGVAAMSKSPACIYALNPTEEKSLYIGSTKATLDAPCGAIINSDDPGALTVDSGACMRATSIGVAGTGWADDVCLNTDYSSESILAEPVKLTPPALDPLLYLPAPPEAPCPPGLEYQYLQIETDRSLNPGNYCGGIQVQNGAQVTLNPGIYVLRGELFDIQGASVTGNGVMLYFTDWEEEGKESKGLKVGSGAAIDLTAPLTGTYSGVAIFVDRTELYHTADMSFESGSTAIINGALYAPNQVVRFHSGADSGNTAGGGLAIVADFIEVTSSDTLVVLKNDFSIFENGSPLRRPVLVE